MLIEKGYKQTEIGIIPKDWEVSPIGSVLKIRHGRSQKNVEVLNGKYPILGTGGQMGTTNSFLYDKPSVLIGRKGTIDKPMYLESPFWTVDTLFYSEINTSAFPKFLYYNFLLINWYAHNEASGVPSLNASKIEGIQIPLPPLAEQKAIAEVLSDTDNLIQGIEKKLAKKRAIKQGAMQQLLSPKEDWERVTLNDVISVHRGGSPRPIQNYLTTASNGINWIKIGDTSRISKYITQSKEKIIPEGVNNSRKVNVGDFLLSNSMSFGRPYILKINGCIHDGWLVLQNYQDSFDKEFLYYTLMSKDIHDQYLTKASGSGVLNLNKELVKTVELNRPKSLKEQTRIATILSDMDIEITQIETKLDKLLTLKQGLMQQLLTGKIRLV